MLEGGTLELAAATAAGSGAIAFATGADETLMFDSSALAAGGTYSASPITGFDAGDIIHLSGLAFASGATATLSGSVLTVMSGGETDQISSFALAPGVDANTPLYAVSNGADGTDVSLRAVGLFTAGATFKIHNYGQVACDAAGGYGVETEGAGTLLNQGNIIGQAIGVLDHDPISTDRYYLSNYGSITSNSGGDAFQGDYSDIELLLNAGTIQGNVVLSNGVGDLLNSTLGKVEGTITAGSGGDTIIAGQSGGSVIGGAGNDIVYANRSVTASQENAATTLDGKGGVNALYGGPGQNTFLAGDGETFDQIWGGLSNNRVDGQGSYANNTVSYAGLAAGEGVFVDLMAYNAYVHEGGKYTLADAIQKTPNVIGSSGVDIITCDRGADLITGGGGADHLYAGAGADTFIYEAVSDSNRTTGYDTIVGFQTRLDKIDLSALFAADPSATLSIASNSMNTSLYLDAGAGGRLAISFVGANAVKASDVIT